MEIMRPKPPSPIAGHPGANPAYEAWAHRHRLTRAAVYRTRGRDGVGTGHHRASDDSPERAVTSPDRPRSAGSRRTAARD